MPKFATLADIIRRAISERAFPAAAIEVGHHDGMLWSAAFGRLTYDPDSLEVTPGTVFDLASLTKVIATATLAMRAVDDGLLALDDRVGDRLAAWRGEDRQPVTIADLLAHSSGLSAYLPFFRDHTGRIEYEQAICTIPLEYAPKTRSTYSDLGFILLGFILEDVRQTGAVVSRPASRWDPATSLAAQFRRLAAFVTDEPLTYNPPRSWRPVTAPTEVDSWRGRLLVGEVHDENAWALGGAAGHAGLFGTAAAVGAFARAMLRTIRGERILADPDTAREFIRKRDIPGSSRALGWDTMLPTSSCGTLLSPTSIGHTGYTGTSLWIDWERDLYVAFLTNRVHPTRENTMIQQIRPLVHNAVVEEIS